MAPEKLLAEWFWIDRWTRSRAFLLPMDARGIYREMLSQAWLRGARLPNDHEAIQRAIGATQKEWRKAWPLVESFWRVDGDALVNDTQLEVYAEARGRSDRASERGLRGAQALHKQNDSSAQAVLKPKPPISDLRSPIKKKEKEPSLSPSLDPFTDQAITERAGRFVERYVLLYQQHRKGARYAVKPARDYAAAVTLCQTWVDDARLDKLATIFLTTDHKFADEGSRTLSQFLGLASWADGKLAEWEAKSA